MNASKEVTIVMPVYNPKKYLRPCIESLLTQSFGDFSLIAIDDASIDGSYDILREYAKRDNRIIALQNPYHLGAARTRNIGIQMAQGTYLSVLDADDYFEQDYLETMCNKLEETGADVAICDFYKRDESSGREYILSPHPFISCKFKDRIVPRDVGDFFFQSFFTNPFTKMWRLSHIFEQELQFQDISNSNDVSFVEIGILTANFLAYVSRPLVHYRYNTLSQISTTRGRNPLCIYEAINRVYQFIKSRGILSKLESSFHSWATEHIVAEILLSEGDAKSHAIQFMRQEGFRKLSMVELTRDDFINVASYREWEKFFYCGIVELEDNDFIYQSFFEKLNKKNNIYALWGYGKLGKHFMEMAKRLNFPIQEIYDCDATKWDIEQIPQVKDFALRDSNVNAIIYTNPNLSKEILQRVKSENVKIKLIDFTMFRQFNIIGTSEMYEND